MGRRIGQAVVAVVFMVGVSGCAVHLPHGRPEPPPVHPDPPIGVPKPLPKPDPHPVPVDPAPLSPAADDLRRQAEEDAVAADIVCFVYDNFYDSDTGEVSMPAEDDFLASVAVEIAPANSVIAYRAKASAMYDAFDSLGTDDLATVATNAGCAAA
jgi:hypothetical protein